jgi:hypothetical protein
MIALALLLIAGACADDKEVERANVSTSPALSPSPERWARVCSSRVSRAGSKLPVEYLGKHTFESGDVRLVVEVEGRTHAGPVSVFFYPVTTKGKTASWVAKDPGKYDATLKLEPAEYAIVANKGGYCFTVTVFGGR